MEENKSEYSPAPVVEATPVKAKRRIGRRGFMKKAALATTAVTLAPDIVAKTVFAPTPVSFERQQSVEKQESVVERLKKKKEELGQEPLTFERAQEISYLAAQMYTVSVSSGFTTSDIVGDFYIVEGKEDEERGLHTYGYNSPAVLRLKERYPNADITPEEEVMIHGDSLSGITKAFVSDSNNIFAYLESHNGQSTISQLMVPNKDHLASDKGTAELPGTIFTTFLTNSLHEMVHHERETTEKKPLETEVADPLIDLVISRNPGLTKDDIVSCTKNGFAISVADKSGKSYYFNGLEETTASYGAEQILKKNGMAYSRIEGSHHQSTAFSFILERAGISESELLESHKKFEIKDILIKIARSAKGIDQTDESAQLKFGIQFLADLSKSIDNLNLDWPEKYSKYFTS